MAATDTKILELARLLEQFGSGSPSSTGSANELHPYMMERVLTLLRDVEIFLSTRTQHRRDSQQDGRRHLSQDIVAPRLPFSGVDSGIESDPEEYSPKASIEEKYLHSFNLMIPRSGGLKQWAEKVKEVIEKSRKQFKPLTEQKGDGGSCGNRKEGKAATIGSTPRRSYSATEDVVDYMEPNEGDANIDVNVTKKRCVGRNAIGGLMTGGRGQIDGEWKYDAAVSYVAPNRPNQTHVIATGETAEHSPWRSQSLAQPRTLGIRNTAMFSAIEKESPRTTLKMRSIAFQTCWVAHREPLRFRWCDKRETC